MRTRKTIAISIPEELVGRIKANADRCNLSVSAYVTMLLTRALEVER